MSERSITIYVKDDVSLAKMMAAIFREYEPSIDKIKMEGVDTPLDVKLNRIRYTTFAGIPLRPDY